MKASGFFTKLLIVILSVFALSQIVFTVIFSSPSENYVKSDFFSKEKNEIENVVIDKQENKRSGKTGTYVNISSKEDGKSLTEYAKISNLYISDIDASVLPDLKGLQVHYLVLNNVHDFNLKDLDTRKLFSITLMNSPISDFSSLADSDNLVSISINDMELDNLDFLKNTKKLTEFNMYNVKIKDISKISDVASLERLGIYRCNLSSLKPISKLKNLKELSLSTNNITDLSPIKELNKLQYIILDNNSIEGEADFSSMKNLVDVYAPFNSINEIKIHPEASPSSLTFSYNNIKSIDSEFIETIKKTDCKVNLFGNIISDHTSLQNVPNIIYQDENYKNFTVNEHQQYISTLSDFVKSYIKPEWSELKKAAVAYCVMSSRIKYFHNYNTSPMKEADYVHTEYGALVNKLAVCDGFSYAYRDILKLCGIKSEIYHGDMNTQSDDSTHAWNIIYIDSKPYHCDLTSAINAENSLSKFKYYDLEKYLENILSSFGKSDIFMEENKYYLLETEAPKCTENISPTTISSLVYDIAESEERYFFIDKNVIVEKGDIKTNE